MKLLLDTHVWIWSLEDPSRLRPKVATALTSPKNEVWLSPISAWEVSVLVARGRLRLHGFATARAWIAAALERVPLREAPVTLEVALGAQEMRMDHDDPADRMLAATAHVYDLALVTADERLLAGSGYRTLAVT